MDDTSLQDALGCAIAGWLVGQEQATTAGQIEQITRSATDAASGCMARLQILPRDFVFPRRVPDPGRGEAERQRAKGVIEEALQTATEHPSKPSGISVVDDRPARRVIPLRFDLDISVSGLADEHVRREKSG